jgi:hypothetical protein
VTVNWQGRPNLGHDLIRGDNFIPLQPSASFLCSRQLMVVGWVFAAGVTAVCAAVHVKPDKGERFWVL